MGMTPDLVAGVWLGFDRPTTIMPGAAGGSLAAPIWGAMMARYYAGRAAPATWTPPVGMLTAELDRTTGQVADATTPGSPALHRVLRARHRARAAPERALEAAGVRRGRGVLTLAPQAPAERRRRPVSLVAKHGALLVERGLVQPVVRRPDLSDSPC